MFALANVEQGTAKTEPKGEHELRTQNPEG